MGKLSDKPVTPLSKELHGVKILNLGTGLK